MSSSSAADGWSRCSISDSDPDTFNWMWFLNGWVCADVGVCSRWRISPDCERNTHSRQEDDLRWIPDLPSPSGWFTAAGQRFDLCQSCLFWAAGKWKGLVCPLSGGWTPCREKWKLFYRETWMLCLMNESEGRTESVRRFTRRMEKKCMQVTI